MTTTSDIMDECANLRAELEASGHEGLYCTEERCGCGLDNLVCCGMDIEGDEGIRGMCWPAYRHDCLGSVECAYPCDGAIVPGGDCYGKSKDGPKRKATP